MKNRPHGPHSAVPQDISGGFAPAEVFMSDSGKHFKNNEV
jgi:hypothetical protein